MSLKDKNLVVTGGENAPKGGSLRATSTSTVARPGAAGRQVTQQAIAATHGVKRGKNLGFIIDATGSRSGAWQEAIAIQTRMFKQTAKVGALNLRLVHFGGSSLAEHPWNTNTDNVAAIMGQVTCRGGQTQILASLDGFLNQSADKKAKNIIVIGDAFEEDLADLKACAAKLAKDGTRVFTFLEGENYNAKVAFQALAEMTGGLFQPFGADMPDLCDAIALDTVGGAAAVAQLPLSRARQLMLAPPKARPNNLG